MADYMSTPRRRFLLMSGAGAGLLLAGCGTEAQSGSSQPEDKAKEVMANEDLMREHGVLRRALLVYRQSARTLRTSPASVPPAALNQTAMLFRTFGEDYHERRLEEPFIFPAVRQAGGAAPGLVDVLLAQHRRGREITDYMLSVTQGGSIGSGGAEPAARAMDAMVLMYEEHMAREDTVIFPAWKEVLSGAQYDELSDRFEEIEHQMFGTDGFAQAVRQIAAIEQSLGLSDLAQFTAPPPPQA
jgi:hemerythrin-like domain-containing protein